MKCLSEDQALTVQIINSLRDAAQHYLLSIWEQQLYVYAQAGVTLYSGLLELVFTQKLKDVLPERVLPISTSPPSSLDVVMTATFEEIKSLIGPKSRQRFNARATVRSLAIIEASLRGERSQPSKAELDKLLRKLLRNQTGRTFFPVWQLCVSIQMGPA